MSNSTSSGSDDEVDGLTRGWAEVYSTLSVSLVVGAIVYVLFEIFRRYKNGATPAYGGNVMKPELAKILPERPLSPFGWLAAVHSVDTDEQLLRLTGLDAYIVLRYLWLHLRTTFLAAVCGLIVLIPTYQSGGEDLDDEFYVATMSNLEDGDNKFWASILIGYILAGYTLYSISQEYQHFAKLRNQFLAHGSPDVSFQTMYSVMVEDLPCHLRSSAMLHGYFEYLFPGKVHSTTLAMEGKKVDKLMHVREDIARQLETLYIYELHHPDKAPVMVRPYYSDFDDSVRVFLGEESTTQMLQRWFTCRCCLCGPAKVEKIPYYEAVLRVLNQKVQEIQQMLMKESDEVGAAVKSAIKVKVIEESKEGMEGAEGAEKKVDSGVELAVIDKEDEQLLKGPSGEAQLVSQGGPTKRSSFWNAFGMSWKADAPAPNSGLSVRAKDVYSGEDAAVTHELNYRFTLLAQHSSGTGFVTFKTLKEKEMAIQLLLSNKFKVQALAAPEARDVIWHDIHQSVDESQNRRSVAKTAFATLTVFFSIPLAACASASLETIEEIVPPLSQFSGQFWYTLLGSSLPAILSLALLAIVPILFKVSAENVEYYKTREQVQTIVFGRYYNLTLAYVYISLTAGSVFDALADIISDPLSILSVLANTIPGTAVYFLNVLILKTFQGASMELSRLVPHLLYWFFSRKGDGELGPRDLKKRDQANSIAYGMLVPPLMASALIGYVFELICPVVEIFTCIYFLFMYTVYKHQFIYVYERPSESGGKLFFPIYKRTFVGIMMGQLTNAGYLLIRQAFWPFILAVLLFLVTYSVSGSLTEKYERYAANLSLEVATYHDEDPNEEEIATFHEDAFKQPALKDLEEVSPVKPDEYAAKSVEEAQPEPAHDQDAEAKA
mmetsp:Transcript_1674/g.7307  ORF Transcript_1674/g.7307 Transcript_1674/m.7307 type:complete len:890 (-) Transcript_1674:318-2987(-)